MRNKTPKIPKQKKPWSKKKKIWVTVLVVFLLALAVPTSDTEEKKEEKPKETEKVEKKKKPEKEKVNPNGFTDDQMGMIVAITQSISDEYLAHYKAPWSFDDWTVAKFDDQGNIMVTTKYTLKEVSAKQDVMCVFYWNEEGESYLPHFLSVGPQVFYDDGYCDEFFANMGEILEAME